MFFLLVSLQAGDIFSKLEEVEQIDPLPETTKTEIMTIRERLQVCFCACERRRERHRYLTRKTQIFDEKDIDINFVHVFCKDNLHLLTPPPHVDKSIYHVASTMFSVKIKCMKSTVYNSPLLTHVDERKYRVLAATVSPLHRSRFSSASSQLSCRCLY
jgi:hypothetical protein